MWTSAPARYTCGLYIYFRVVVCIVSIKGMQTLHSVHFSAEGIWPQQGAFSIIMPQSNYLICCVVLISEILGLFLRDIIYASSTLSLAVFVSKIALLLPSSCFRPVILCPFFPVLH